MVECVLFDMDGVLIDSEKIILEAAIKGLRVFGVNAEPEDFLPYVGAGEDRYIGCVAQKYGTKFVPEMKSVVYDIYADIIKKHPETVYPGVKEVIEKVKSKYKCAVCSAADYTKVCHNLNAIGVTQSFFDAVVSGSDVKRQKPFPDVFLKGAEKCGVEPAKCLAIDDSLNGIRAAVAAGGVSAGITTMFSKQEILKTVKPDFIVEDIRELPALIETVNSNLSM